MQEGKWTKTSQQTHKTQARMHECAHTDTHIHTQTHTLTQKPQPLPVFMLHLAEPDFIRGLDLAMSLTLSHTHTCIHPRTHIVLRLVGNRMRKRQPLKGIPLKLKIHIYI